MTTDRPRRRDWPGALVGGVLLWILVGGLVALTTWPSSPTTTRGWVLLFVVGPPAWVALEWLGARLFGREMGERISGESFSWARILFALFVLLALLVPAVWWSIATGK